MKHKHCDVIKAWADGEKIQIYIPSSNTWVDTEPNWYEERMYRVKPKEFVTLEKDEKCLAFSTTRFTEIGGVNVVNHSADDFYITIKVLR